MRINAAIVLLAITLAACAPTRAPVVERSPVLAAASEYRVQQGDTLYSIAWRHQLDYRALARSNDIRPPYALRVGRVLILREPRPVAPAARPPARLSGWRWPVDARPLGGRGSHGLDYVLPGRTAIGAAAAGEVVYAAGGLGGYRHLVIVRHGPRYLSAYGVNVAPRVAEGQRVGKGEVLAVTSTGVGNRLHFEIRRDGRPVAPAAVID